MIRILKSDCLGLYPAFSAFCSVVGKLLQQSNRMIESVSSNYYPIEGIHVKCLTECVAYQRPSKNVIRYDYREAQRRDT